MPPFRPANLNKRAYPGNASVIGPTRTATLGITTTTCCSSTDTCGACTDTICLGCRCTFCACPFCKICCSCLCTVSVRTVPSGRWKASEQYEARTRDAWENSTNCVTGSPTCLCCTNVGFACTSNISDCKGFFICCGPSTNKWFVAPACTQVSRDWYSRNDGVVSANNCMGSCGWFLPNCAQAQSFGSCSDYWDSYASCLANGAQIFWTITDGGGNTACYYGMPGGGIGSNNPYKGGHDRNKSEPMNVRAFRCVN